MSAYGHVPAPSSSNATSLPVLSYPLPNGKRLTCFPVTRETMPESVGPYLCDVFNTELATGKTYPQDGPVDLETFLSYFFAYTTILGIITDQPKSEGQALVDGTESQETLERLKGDRSWEECLGGCYYVKPNYPGRSSHNAGFLIPPTHRGLKIGMTLGKSYLYYGPALGYRSSVFNLVYKTNVASLAIWDRLGFTKVGLVPKAGRLKTGPNGEEEYVDAHVIWKEFEAVEIKK